jgi:hypothetical protein
MYTIKIGNSVKVSCLKDTTYWYGFYMHYTSVTASLHFFLGNNRPKYLPIFSVLDTVPALLGYFRIKKTKVTTKLCTKIIH